MRRGFTKRLTDFFMTKRLKYEGAVVPMVTPLTMGGHLDEEATTLAADVRHGVKGPGFRVRERGGASGAGAAGHEWPA